MFTKPKSTTKLPLAMLYKRYVAIESAFGKNFVYYVVDNLKRKYFIFDSVNEDFIEIREDEKGTAQEVQILHNRAFSYNDKYYKYNVATKKIEKIDNSDSFYVGIIKDSPNIGKYQLNKYYYASSFQFTINGDIEESVIQSIKGLMSPLTSLTIKTYSDIDIKVDDLVVINKRLYHIESVSKTVKRMPKAFVITTLIINSIL